MHNSKSSITKAWFHLVLAGFIIALTTGCSGFHRAWKQEVSKNINYPPSSIEGAWEGKWLSDVNGHHGRLRCLVQRNEDGTLTTWYHAKYKKVLGFAYSVDVRAEPAPNGHSFEGEADLGKLAGGNYEYKGAVADGVFNATYKSKFDYGSFKMNRPPADK